MASISKKINSNELLTYLLIIIIGYIVSQIFMKKCNRFSVGGEEKCTDNASCCGGCADNNICASHSSNSDTNVCFNRYYTNADGKNLWCAYGKSDQTMGDYCHGLSENAKYGPVLNASCSKCKKKVCTGPKRTPNCGGKARTKETCTGYTKSNASNNESKNLGLGYQCVWVEDRKSCDSYTSWNEQGSTLCTLPSGSGSPPSPPSPPPPPANDKSNSKDASGECVADDGLLGNGWFSFSNDGCIYKGKTYLDYTSAPDGACDCPNWYSIHKTSFKIFAVVGGIIGFFIIRGLIKVILARFSQ